MDEKTRIEQRLDELSLLHDLGKSLSATLDLSELLTQIVEVAVRLAQADEGLLLLPDPDSNVLQIRAAKNVDDQIVRELRLSTDDSLAGRVVRTGQPVLVNNDRGWEKIKTEYLVRSLVYVPLISKGRAIGVLGVSNKTRPHVFTQHDQEMLSALAGYAATAVENALLFEQAVQRSRELDLLVETANALSSSLDLSRVLNAVTRQLTRALAADRCTISHWDSEAHSAHTLAEHRQAIWERGSGPAYDLADFPIRRQVLAQAAPLSTEAGSTDWPAAQALLERWGAARMLALPLQVAGQVMGLAEVYDTQTSAPYTPEETSRTMRAAMQIAPLLLDPETGQDWRKAMFTAAADLLAPSGSHWCAVLTWHPEDDCVSTILEYGGGAWVDEPVEAVGLDQIPALNVVLNEQRIAVLSADDDLNPADRALLDGWHAKMLLAVPLVHKGEPMGLISLADVNQSRVISRRELALAFALANQVAVGLENARLFRDLALSLEELRQAQSRLVQAARLSALGELAAVVAHQINNPLTTVLVDSEILLQDLPKDHPSHASAQAIWQAGKRAKTVVDRLLNLARRDSDTRPLGVNSTIRDTLALAQAHIERGGTSLSVDLADNLPPVRAAPGQLEDVWLNLLINAHDAVSSERAGQVGIQSRAVPDGWVEVVVWDNGIGIPDEHLPQVFEPFFTTKPRGEGTGLGLYICQQTATKLGGQVKIKSQPGVGTRVTVRLPVADN